jgi:hypothetical protein
MRTTRIKHIHTIATDPVILARVADILQRRHAERAPALEKELAQLAAEQQRCQRKASACCRPSVATKPAAT